MECSSKNNRYNGHCPAEAEIYPFVSIETNKIHVVTTASLIYQKYKNKNLMYWSDIMNFFGFFNDLRQCSWEKKYSKVVGPLTRFTTINSYFHTILKVSMQQEGISLVKS